MARDGKKVVLIIEDDADWQQVFRDNLITFPNIHVLQALDPEEGIKEADRNMRELDLIMLDGNFTGKNLTGAYVAESIIDQGYTGMLIAMSSDSDTNQMMMRAGCRDHVHKSNALSKIINFLQLD